MPLCIIAATLSCWIRAVLLRVGRDGETLEGPKPGLPTECSASRSPFAWPSAVAAVLHTHLGVQTPSDVEDQLPGTSHRRRKGGS